jgi:ATP-dependent Clp protease ATP-binding subunit ClpC
MFERFTNGARRVVVLAQEEARMLSRNYIGTEHILLGLLHEGKGVAAKALESMGISLEAVRQQVEEIIGHGQQPPSGHLPFTPRAKKVLELSLREALQLGHNYIGTEHILLGLIREGDGVACQVLVRRGADLNRVRQHVIALIHGYPGKAPVIASTGGTETVSSREPDQLNRLDTSAPDAEKGQKPTSSGQSESVVPSPIFDQLSRAGVSTAMGPRAPVSGKEKAPGPPSSGDPQPETPGLLDILGRNLIRLADEGKLDPVIGREKEIERVMQVLSRRAPGNPVLVGQAGIGRTTVVDGLARKIAAGQVGDAFKDRLIYSLSMEATSGRSSSSEILEAVLEEARSRNVILFFDELLLRLDLWAVLTPLIIDNEVRIIGALTPDGLASADYRILMTAHPTLRRALTLVQVAELTTEDTVNVLKSARDRYERHHQVIIPDDAVAAVARLASEHLAGPLPGKAIDLMDEAAALCRTRVPARPRDPTEYDATIATITEELVAETLAIMLRVSADEAPGSQRPDASRAPRLAPTPMSDDDQAIWGMA